jgi:aspartate 1-decarboxylase
MSEKSTTVPGDLVIIIAYASMTRDEARTFDPRVVFVDRGNRPVSLGSDLADAPEGTGLTRGDRLAEITG